MAHPDDTFVFNIVWTGGVFHHLRYFACSLLGQSTARYRFVANGCSPESLTEMEAFCRSHSGRVIEVLDVSPDRMVAHGVALDTVRQRRDDGELFCFVDPDIKARQPFVGLFAEQLDSCDAVTSGAEVWTDDNVRPADHLGVGGRHFYDVDGFVFGSPHLAMYRRQALDETTERWGVGLGSAGPELSEGTRARIAAAGRLYPLYDTGKIVNILLQLDGHRLRHIEHPDLLHIGGLPHYLAPGRWVTRDGVSEPEWARSRGVEARFEVARFTALVLQELDAGRTPPEVPAGLDVSMARRLELVRGEMIDLVEAHRTC